jgi:UDP:flavonoid glycosyltransferase YjiC (YdhE family)
VAQQVISNRRQRILFVAEDVALAGVVRLKVLAESLDASRYEVWFACSRFNPLIFAGTHFRRVEIHSVPAGTVQRRAALGGPLYDRKTLLRYAHDDLAIMEAVQPALVIGDMRLSLAATAPKLGIPYAAFINAYWSPYAVRDGFPIPDHPLVELFGIKRVAPRFAQGLRFVFYRSARPVNQLRRHYGLPELGSLPEVLAYGDHTIYPDVPELVPTQSLPNTHRYLGPVLWSPRVALPTFWPELHGSRPVVYVTLGSSGPLRALDAVLAGLAELPVTVLIASAGRFAPRALPRNVWCTDYLPGQFVAQRAAVVICNGGSGTAYQALNEGVPVLGIPSHLDQYLCMAAIERAGAGLMLRGASAAAGDVGSAVEQLLNNGRYAAAARTLASAFQRMDAAAAFRAFVEETAPFAQAMHRGVAPAAPLI